jgi:hypothetical protein
MRALSPLFTAVAIWGALLCVGLLAVHHDVDTSFWFALIAASSGAMAVAVWL